MFLFRYYSDPICSLENMAIKWERLGQLAFDTSVERLLMAEFGDRPEVSAFSPDGRGGDGGIDFQATSALGQVTIYQFKYFPEGIFRVSKNSRKRQVRNSFDTAMKRAPQRWVLVVPCKLTLGERSFVDGLAGDGVDVEIDVLDVVGLDVLLARHDGVRRYLERDVVLEAVSEYQLQTAVINNGDDLSRRIRDLHSRGSDMDPYWAPDFRIDDEMLTITPRPKSADAYKKRPIVTQFHLDEECATDEDRAAFSRAIGFGTSESITVPIVARKMSGPEFFQVDGPGMLSIEGKKMPRPDAPITIRLLASDGTPLGEHDGAVTHSAPGASGATLELCFYNALTVRFLLAFDLAEPCNANLNLAIERLMIADAADAMALRRLLCEETARLEILHDSEVLALLSLNTPRTPTDSLWNAREQFANDLAFLERRSGSRRRLPKAYTERDQLLARVARLALEGHCVLVPSFLNFHFKAAHNMSPEDTRELAQVLESPKSFVTRIKTARLDICGISCDLGPAWVWSPVVTVSDADRLLGRLHEGLIGGEQINLVPADEQPWRLVHHPAWDPEAPFIPEPWKLVDIDEHTSLEAIRAEATAAVELRLASEANT